MEPAPTQASCDRCYRLHLLADLVQHDDDLLCPDCRGHTRLVLAPGDPSELARLRAIEAAAQGWFVAYKAAAADQAGDTFKRERLLPIGQSAALLRLAELLDALTLPGLGPATVRGYHGWRVGVTQEQRDERLPDPGMGGFEDTRESCRCSPRQAAIDTTTTA